MNEVNYMDSCELASTVTALACLVKNCVPKEDLPLVTAILSQLASTLATITVNENTLKLKQAPVEEPSVDVVPDLTILP